MVILGLNTGEFNSSAAIIIDGKVIAAAQEERFNKKKFTKDFPLNSIKFCLKKSKLKFSDINFVTTGWNPSSHMYRYNPIISKNRTFREYNLYTVSDNLFNNTNRVTGNFTLVSHDNNKFPSIYHVRHHMAHASNAYYLSNYKKAAILTSDFKGETESTTWSIGRKNKIKTLQTQNFPNSLGMFYSTFTSILGYKPDSDEWKVMAISAFNVDCKEDLRKIKSTYKLLSRGRLELNQKYFGSFHYGNKDHLYTQELLNLLGIKEVKYKSNPSLKEIKIAKALQKCAEEIGFHFLKHLYKITKNNNLVLSGGFFMNSVFNGKIKKKTKFKNVFIPYAPTDTGNSIGSALYVYYHIKNKPKKPINNSSLIGPIFDNKEILYSLKRKNLKYKKINNFSKYIASECKKGKIVGYFRNGLEFGDRSLGSRSILADPTSHNVKNKINNAVKYRENYRPFAPSVIQEKSSNFFEVEKNYVCKYMEKIVKVKKKFRNDLKGITHLDGSARLQTVSIKENKDFYKILHEFEKLSGFPILLNTSFNVNGEPIVCTPDDAISTFFNCKLDTLVIGDYVIKKK